VQRLNLDTLGSIPASMRSGVDPRRVDIGIVHLGIGGFHRAHQAVYTEHAMAATGDTRWGISAATQRSARVRDQLAPQDGLYTVAVRDGTESSYQVVSSVREVLDGTTHIGAVIERLADPSVTVVTLTVTEKAYRLHPQTRRLDLGDPHVRSDAAGETLTTVVGRLVAGLRRRRLAGAGPLAVVSCDNLTENGAQLRDAVYDYCRLLRDGDSLAAWIAEQVTFPATMVDRIVPTTTEADRAAVAAAIGLFDDGAVVAEPFTQWVIEDDFRSARPAWESAGAALVDDVRPYELTKLRTLNASHSLLAYLGRLAGVETIADAVSVDALAESARILAEVEVRPTLPPAKGIDHLQYVETTLRRFANPVLGHTTRQVASDGSQKIGPRLLGTIADSLAQGNEPRIATLAIAAWLRQLVIRRTDDGAPLMVDDPLAEAICDAAKGHHGSAAVRAALAAAGVNAQLLEDERFTALVQNWYVSLDRAGAVATARIAIR
jgi:fructuronate reductase